jgi:hypothetical protein
MPLTKFSDLDFDQIKTQIKDYLRSNSNFTDFDFEGSNFSVLIDVLAYNTYISSYNANMLANEGFIDSATLRENIVALSRNIGYLPSSRKASRATVSFFVDTSSLTTNPSTLTLRAGLMGVSDSFGGSNYTFCIPEDITVNVVDDLAFFNDIQIYEGTFLENNFTVDTSQQNQRFIIPNSNVDTSTLIVKVKDFNFALSSVRYDFVDSIIDIEPESKIYLLQEVADERYEILFGDGVFGNKLENSNYITATYIITNGSQANGIRNFTFAGRLVDNNDRVVTTGVSDISVTQESTGGGEIESVDSIRNYAPKNYAAQNRAVTATDYETITKKVFPDTESSVVFGGESVSPPQYGRVFIGIKPKNGNYLSNFIKFDIEQKLKRYSVAGIMPKVIDLNYLFIEVNSNVYYNTNKAEGSSYIKTTVLESLQTYANSVELNKFGSRLKYSKLLSVIDNTSSAITSNITKIVMRRDLRPVLNSFADYEICFGNRFHVNPNGYNIKTTGFYIDGYVGEVFLTDSPNADLKTGVINLIRKISETEGSIIRRNIGTVDYEKGEILLSPLRIVNTSLVSSEISIIEIQAVPESNDVIGLQDLFLQLDISKSVVNAVPDTISSGSDVSGVNYSVSSSFTNGSITR